MTPAVMRFVPCLFLLGLQSVFGALGRLVIICLCFMIVGSTVTLCAVRRK